MRTQAERSEAARRGGLATYRKYGRAGMREMSRAAKRAGVPGGRPMQTTIADLESTPQGRALLRRIESELC